MRLRRSKYSLLLSYILRPLAHRGSFWKGVSFFLFVDFGFSAKSNCQVVFAKDLLLMYKKKKKKKNDFFIFINVINVCFKHEPLVAKYYHDNSADFSE